jgi:enoyl-CoA hydratase/carnithine racemase
VSASEEHPVLVDHLDEGISRITLNRPEKRNAMNQAARSGLVDALDECREAQSKVIVLTGNGPAFCAGIDLKETAAREAEGWEPTTAFEHRTTWRAVQLEIKNHPAIVIAAVNGFALGGGVTLINASDLAIAADEASIGMPEIGFGIYPNLAGPSTQLRVNQKRAAWMVLTAERIDGETAAVWGIVNRSVPLANLMGETMELARRVGGFNAAALAWSKQALWEIPAHTSDWAAALKYGEDVGVQIQARSARFRDGLASFSAGERNPGQGALS